ncbi:MAG: hypothetical protein HUJ67_06545 [Ruminiclostridium sp.]|nr:hypothetical protein [Ruminiclostridium sp.]
MAKKFGVGVMMAVGAVSAAVGGVAAFLSRKSIEKTVQDISEKLEAKIDDEFQVEDEEVVIHSVDKEETSEESDFVDTEGVAEAAAEEEPTAAEEAKEASAEE